MAASSPSIFTDQEPSIARILGAAHQQLFAHGYSALTMDALAHEVGMSKKTLYVHFPSKEALVERIIDCVGRSLHTQFEAVLADRTLAFPERVRAVVEVAGGMLARITPTMLRDFQRFAPHIYERIEALRQEIIPFVFGRLIRDGIAAGKVRADIDVPFATEFWLQAIRGLLQPSVLDRTQLTLRQTLVKALNLFFCGLLTPAGRKDYEKHLAS